MVTPTQILVHGRAAGEVSLLIWDELERSRSFDLRVDVDVSAAAEEEKRVFPDEQITVSPSRSAIVLSGHVSTEDVSKRAGMIAEAYSKNVVNVLTFGPVGAQEVSAGSEVRRSGPLRGHATWDQHLLPRAWATPSPPARPDNSARSTVHNQAATTTTSGGTTTTTTTATPPTVNVTDFLISLWPAPTSISAR